ncbi:MAG: DUF1552 domain-containing protein, partial [Myxococcales bacterium]|nr:DUF1552 domain-containing protein [Myxococcales bacterium]
MSVLIPRRPMNRRTVLRGLMSGAAATVALPWLDAMTGASARAQGAAPPTRFGVWFWGNGIRRQHWTPDVVGPGWQPKAELAPLVDAGLRDWLTVVTGLEIKTANHPHHSGMAGIMTGAAYQQVGNVRDTIVSTFAYPSIDQVAAAAFEGQAPYRSLEVAVCRFRGTDEGTTFQHLSHNGPNNVNPSEYSPRALHRRLFGMGPAGPQIDFARRSVLDAVSGRITALQNTVGARDRMRLQQHFDSVRALELRLAAGAAECVTPPEPGDYPDVEGREQIAEKNAIQSQLIALALACDLTRAFSVMFSTAGSGVIVWPAGAQNSLHQICHDEAAPQPTVHAAVTYIMAQLAVFLRHMGEGLDQGAEMVARTARRNASQRDVTGNLRNT